MWTKRLIGLAFLTLVSIDGTAAEEPHVAPVVAYIQSHVMPWVSDPVIIASVQAQNAENAGLDQAAITALDQTWRTEAEAEEHPMIDRVLAKPLSIFLRNKQDQSDGSITEIFVTDAKGLNVGQSEITSDYWQGDEAKFTQGLSAVGGRIFVDAAEKDESTQMFQSQASIAIVDASGKPIGVITIGVNLDQL